MRFGKRVVTAFDVEVPAMCPPPFAVSAGVRVVPVHLLPSAVAGESICARLATDDVPPGPAAYVVVGAGKTGADAVIYLLGRGVEAALEPADRDLTVAMVVTEVQQQLRVLGQLLDFGCGVEIGGLRRKKRCEDTV